MAWNLCFCFQQEKERDHFSQFVTESFTAYCKRKRRDKVSAALKFVGRKLIELPCWNLRALYYYHRRGSCRGREWWFNSKILISFLQSIRHFGRFMVTTLKFKLWQRCTTGLSTSFLTAWVWIHNIQVLLVFRGHGFHGSRVVVSFRLIFREYLILVPHVTWHKARSEKLSLFIHYSDFLHLSAWFAGL